MLAQVLKLEIEREIQRVYFSKSIYFLYSCYLHTKNFLHIIRRLQPTNYLLNFSSE